MSGLLVLAPLRIEAHAARRGTRDAEVVRTGMGATRSRASVVELADRPARAVAVMGFCGALDDSLEPGDVVVASELRSEGGGTFNCEHLQGVEEALSASGVRARRGPIVSVLRMTRGAERAKLAETGAVAVDLESAWLASLAAGRPFATVRAVVDTPSRELVRISTVPGGIKAYRALSRAAGALENWMNTLPDQKET